MTTEGEEMAAVTEKKEENASEAVEEQERAPEQQPPSTTTSDEGTAGVDSVQPSTDVSETGPAPAPEQSVSSEQAAAIPPELLVKHPLQYRWVLWYCKADRNKEWEDCLKQVTAFDTVEDFWALYNHIQLASGLTWGSDYYLFKEGIKPMWEDDNNIKGGRWLILVDKMRRNQDLDHYWLELLMAMIGEQFEDHGEQVCGAVVNVRQKGDKVSLWTRDSLKDEVNKRVGTILKEKLDIKETLKYEIHKDTSVKHSSTVKPRLTV